MKINYPPAHERLMQTAYTPHYATTSWRVGSIFIRGSNRISNLPSIGLADKWEFSQYNGDRGSIGIDEFLEKADAGNTSVEYR